MSAELDQVLVDAIQRGYWISMGLDGQKQDGSVIISVRKQGGLRYQRVDTDVLTLSARPEAVSVLVRKLTRE